MLRILSGGAMDPELEAVCAYWNRAGKNATLQAFNDLKRLKMSLENGGLLVVATDPNGNVEGTILVDTGLHWVTRRELADTDEIFTELLGQVKRLAAEQAAKYGLESIRLQTFADNDGGTQTARLIENGFGPMSGPGAIGLVLPVPAQ